MLTVLGVTPSNGRPSHTVRSAGFGSFTTLQVMPSCIVARVFSSYFGQETRLTWTSCTRKVNPCLLNLLHHRWSAGVPPCEHDDIQIVNHAKHKRNFHTFAAGSGWQKIYGCIIFDAIA
jgi:hypothetical protein